MCARIVIAGATRTAICSAPCKAIRFGTSLLTINEVYELTATTNPTPKVSATHGAPQSRRAIPRAGVQESRQKKRTIAGEGDSDLDSRQEPRAESNARASARCEPATSASTSGAQARWPGGHNGELGHRKQAIEHDQTRDDP